MERAARTTRLTEPGKQCLTELEKRRIKSATWTTLTGKQYLGELEKRRRELGMSRAMVAKLAKVSVPTVDRILMSKEAAPTLPVIRAIAVVLKVEIRLTEEITVVPRIDADEYRKERARTKAVRLVHRIQGGMGLEAQAMDTRTVDKLIDRTVHELLAGSSRKLWED